MAQLAHVARSAAVDCRRTFTVARNRRGYWIARDLDGMIEGVFVDRRTAIHFALFEADGRRSAVIVIPDAEAAEGSRVA
jgi:hypothetical protein